ncbi:GNAT family N-acetyltransferase [Aquimarina hainanensis]|uniref:GNAT family N-acetyltransferase n=1 Tax=Aquimarina hainanensis TaxID=1578017 RepID=A0ABW5NGX8_9FLAO|nr:GNAT family N-acetyltransferase [Aquimarina sp. TRL1]QKX07491.1 GNAT family N-acetyltransferase [Aquimarina sp. TRL1]
MSTIKIRPIELNDNKALAAIIREVLVEMGVPKVGTAYEDKALDMMYETYNESRGAYFVVECDGSVLGGAGIAPLENGEEDVCELQKMYVSSKMRGKGVGRQLMEICLSKAKEEGFESCYLETMPYMESAKKLYGKVGFEPLEKPMGDTGHYNCQEWMIKKL